MVRTSAKLVARGARPSRAPMRAMSVATSAEESPSSSVRTARGLRRTGRLPSWIRKTRSSSSTSALTSVGGRSGLIRRHLDGHHGSSRRVDLAMGRVRGPEAVFEGEEPRVEHLALCGDEGTLVERRLLEIEIGGHEGLRESARPVFLGERRRALLEGLAVRAHEDDPRREPLPEGEGLEIAERGAGLDEELEHIEERRDVWHVGAARAVLPRLPSG